MTDNEALTDRRGIHTPAPARSVNSALIRDLRPRCARRVAAETEVPWRAVIRLVACVLGGAAHLLGMGTRDQRLRLQVMRRDAPDVSKLVDWVLGIAEARHRAYLNGEPDPFGCPLPIELDPHPERQRRGGVLGTVGYDIDVQQGGPP